MSLTVKRAAESVIAFSAYTVIPTDRYPRHTERTASPILPVGRVAEQNIIVQHYFLALKGHRCLSLRDIFYGIVPLRIVARYTVLPCI